MFLGWKIIQRVRAGEQLKFGSFHAEHTQDKTVCAVVKLILVPKSVCSG